MPAPPPPRPPADEPSAADVVGTSRLLAATLRTGTHKLPDRALRELYGLRRVTAPVRVALARELERAGLEPVGPASRPPLVVRQLAPGAEDGLRLAAGRRGGRSAAVAATALVLVAGAVAGVAFDGSGSTGGSAPPRATVARSARTGAVTGVARTTVPMVTLPAADLLAAATRSADADDYSGALALARPLGPATLERIGRKASRRLAVRAADALDRGRRGTARTLVRRGGQFPATSQLAVQRRRLAAADARAARAARAATTATPATVLPPTTTVAPTVSVPATPVAPTG